MVLYIFHVPVSKKEDKRSPSAKEKKKTAKGLTSCWFCMCFGCSDWFGVFIFFDSEGKEIPVREEDTFVPHSFLLLMYVWTQYSEEEQRECWAMLDFLPLGTAILEAADWLNKSR